MKDKKLFIFFITLALTALTCVCFVTCSFDNPIIDKWWDDEPEYVPITKMVPQVTYDTIIEHDVVYKQVFVKLPPEVIHDVVYEQLPPQVIHDVVYEQLPPQIVYVQLPPEVIHDVVYVKLPPDVIYVQIPPQVIYNTIVTNITNINNNVISSQQVPPEVVDNQLSDEEIINLIKDKPELIKEIVKQISPEEIVKYLTEDQLKTVIQYIIDNNILTDEQIKEIITKIPPDKLVTYLTDEQIKYIIQQQPPQVILQSLKIIDIEYIIFAGNADVYNGPPGVGGNTPLTTQEINSNKASVSAIAQALKDHPEYLIMLHGHANPVDFTDGETGELTKLSLDRANSVEDALRTQFKSLNGGVDIDDSRVSVSGYGGEKVLFGNNSAYTALNRRVEMILVWVGVDTGADNEN